VISTRRQSPVELLNAWQAGLLPGCLYLISMWYRRDEAQVSSGLL
jgi:hypothetical protein